MHRAIVFTTALAALSCLAQASAIPLVKLAERGDAVAARALPSAPPADLLATSEPASGDDDVVAELLSSSNTTSASSHPGLVRRVNEGDVVHKGPHSPHAPGKLIRLGSIPSDVDTIFYDQPVNIRRGKTYVFSVSRASVNRIEAKSTVDAATYGSAGGRDNPILFRFKAPRDDTVIFEVQFDVARRLSSPFYLIEELGFMSRTWKAIKDWNSRHPFDPKAPVTGQARPHHPPLHLQNWMVGT